MNEQRQDPRILCRARFACDAPGEAVIDREVVDLSLGGLCLRLTRPPPRGTRLQLALRLPELDGPALSLWGEVVWVSVERPPRVGLRFVDLSAEARAVLTRYIELYRLGVLRYAPA